jgi:glucose-6-phosphate-specific signal transduction histidine kinase
VLVLSPLFSWIGWLIALPPVWLALRFGWFGWLSAAAIGAAAGGVAGEIAGTALALPFGLVALVALRAVLGRQLSPPRAVV